MKLISALKAGEMLLDSEKDTNTETSVTVDSSNGPMGWIEIERQDVSNWNEKLLATDAHYRQYPYWCEPCETEGKFRPRFYVYRTNIGEAAYLCILERKIFGIKIGLVFRGPVFLGSESINDQVIDDLLSLAKTEGYGFLRFTNRDKSVMSQLLEHSGSRQAESYPFDRDPPRSLVVIQAETDNATLASFQTIARRNIRAAEKAGYVISKSSSSEDYRSVWPMFQRLSNRKGFELSARSLETWLKIVETADNHGCSTLYTASLNGVCVSAIHLLRYGRMSEFMLGALDLELLGKNPSPSALLHWTAMRDAYQSGCKDYNLGGPGDGVRNKVFQFKSKFRPELRQAEPPVTVILKPMAYRCWELMVLKGWIGLRRQTRRVMGKCIQVLQSSLRGANGSKAC